MDRHQADATEQVSGVRCVNNRRVLKGIFWVVVSQSGIQISSVQVRHGAICQKTFTRWTENWVRFAKNALAALCEPLRSAPLPCPRATIVVGRSQAGAAIRPA
jgi:hypothetical protein